MGTSAPGRRLKVGEGLRDEDGRHCSLVCAAAALVVSACGRQDAGTNALPGADAVATAPCVGGEGSNGSACPEETRFHGEPPLAAYDLYIARADGSDLVRLTDGTLSGKSSPAWSPDGSRIAFVASRPAESADIYLVTADGGGRIRLTDHPRRMWLPPGLRTEPGSPSPASFRTSRTRSTTASSSS